MKSWFKRVYERVHGKYRNRKRIPTSRKRKLFLERLSDRALLDANPLVDVAPVAWENTVIVSAPVLSESALAAHDAVFAEGESGVPASRDLDANHDGWVTPLDALKIINDLNANGARLITNAVPLAPDFTADMEAGRTELLMDVYLVGAWDPDCDSTSLGIGREPGSGTVEVLYGGVIAYRPQEGFTGVDTFVYTVVDSAEAQASGTITVNVGGYSLPVVNDQDLTTDEDTPLTFAGSGTNVTSYDASTTNTPNNGILAENADGSFTYTPNVNFVGVDVFEIVGSNGLEQDTGVVTVFVGSGGGENHPPLAENTSATTDEDTPTTLTLVGIDQDGDNLTFSIVTDPSNGTVTLNGNQVEYIPNVNFTGQDGFTFMVSDGRGGTAQASATVQVGQGGGGGENHPPSAENTAATTEEDTPVNIQLVAIDQDGDSLVYSSEDPLHGMTVVNGAALTYTPDVNFVGVDTFTFIADDGRGGTSQAAVSVTIGGGGGGVNAPPDAQNVTATTDEDTPVTV
ncbi:MAG: Ig-like domain-containing protein, partial [Patescibacteria group bacterium]